MRYSDEERAAVLAALQPHMEQGEPLTAAYARLREEFQRDGKTIPNLWTVRKWLTAADPKQDPEVEAPAEDSEATPDAASDYVRKLEIVCRMYRRADEYSRDEVCDYLLPDLLADEAEGGAR